MPGGMPGSVVLGAGARSRSRPPARRGAVSVGFVLSWFSARRVGGSRAHAVRYRHQREVADRAAGHVVPGARRVLRSHRPQFGAANDRARRHAPRSRPYTPSMTRPTSCSASSACPARGGLPVLRRRPQPRGDHARCCASRSSRRTPIDDARRHAASRTGCACSGVPVSWLTLIQDWDPPHRFVDQPGPRALRAVAPHPRASRPPVPAARSCATPCATRSGFGPLGELAHRALVRRDLEAIFDFRASGAALRRRPRSGGRGRAPSKMRLTPGRSPGESAWYDQRTTPSGPTMTSARLVIPAGLEVRAERRATSRPWARSPTAARSRRRASRGTRVCA